MLLSTVMHSMIRVAIYCAIALTMAGLFVLAKVSVITEVDVSSGKSRTAYVCLGIKCERDAKTSDLDPVFRYLSLRPGAEQWRQAFERSLILGFNPLAFRRDFDAGGALADFSNLANVYTATKGCDRLVLAEVIRKYGGVDPMPVSTPSAP